MTSTSVHLKVWMVEDRFKSYGCSELQNPCKRLTNEQAQYSIIQLLLTECLSTNYSYLNHHKLIFTILIASFRKVSRRILRRIRGGAWRRKRRIGRGGSRGWWHGASHDAQRAACRVGGKFGSLYGSLRRNIWISEYIKVYCFKLMNHFLGHWYNHSLYKTGNF